jgi:hypothetical protein
MSNELASAVHLETANNAASVTDANALSIEASNPSARKQRDKLQSSRGQKSCAQHLTDLQITGTPRQPAVDACEMAHTADAIRKASGEDNILVRWPDKEAINQLLQNKSDAQRAEIDRFYKARYGISLEEQMRRFESGSDLDKFLNILYRKDNDVADQSARRIHEDLLEFGNAVQRRDRPIIEKDIRDTLSSLNSDQTKQFNADYLSLYGTDLKTAGSKSNLSPATKESLDIYLNGNNARTDSDYTKLATNALQSGDVSMFEESMRDAPPSVRSQFTAEKLAQYFDLDTLGHVLDYVAKGKLKAATQVTDNTGVLVNNAEGIELAVNRMTPDERKQYVQGMQLAQGNDLPQLSAEDKLQATNYYTNLHTSMIYASNESDVARWEGMIVSGDNAVLSSLANHRGHIYNDGVTAIRNDFDNMSAQDWQDFKDHPEKRQVVQAMLDSLKGMRLRGADVDALMTTFDRKVTAPTYEAASTTDTRSTADLLHDQTHWYGNDPKAMLDVLSKMSPANQKRYREDSSFRQELDTEVSRNLASFDLVAAKIILSQVKNGEPLTDDPLLLSRSIITDVLTDGGAADAVSKIELAFKQNPKLRERIINPSRPDDRLYSQAFQESAHLGFGAYYDSIVQPLLDKGFIPLENKLSLRNSAETGTDISAVCQDIVSATPDERARLRHDSQYANSLLASLIPDERYMAMIVARQGEEKPEDKIHLGVEGIGQQEHVLAYLKGMKAEDVRIAQVRYAHKYGSSLDGDVLNIMSGHDREEAARVLNSTLGLQERTNLSRDSIENSLSGFGTSFDRNVAGSGAPVQAEDTLNQVVRTNSAWNRASVEQVQAYAEKVRAAKINAEAALRFEDTATDNIIASKRTVAETATNAAIGAVAIGSLIATAGMDAPLLVALSVGVSGSAIKVVGSLALEGADYDNSVKNIAKDTALGFVGAATSVIGPGEIAAALSIGKEAAQDAVSISISQLASGSAGNALQSGGEVALQKGMQTLMRNTLISGAKEVSQNALLQLADKAIATEITGEVRQAAVQQLAASLNDNLMKQLGGGTTRFIMRHSLNAAGGAAGGLTSGATEGALDWDSNKTTKANLWQIATKAKQSGEAGLIGGAAVSVASHGIMKGVSALRTSTVTSSEHAVTIPTDAKANAPERLTPISVKGQVLDSRGNLFETDWPRISPERASSVRQEVLHDLTETKASGGSVLDKLRASGLSENQQARVLDSLGEVREHYAKTFATDVDQRVNWVHTQGELARVLDSAKASGLTANQTEDALLASAFSDSVKTKANFTTHHLDGELAAEYILKSKLDGDFTSERLNGIMHAIREHQIAPPGFMAMIYSGVIKRSIQAEGRAITTEEATALDALSKKISKPLDSPLVDALDGGKMLALTPAERSLLKRTGNDEWYVPSADTPWYKESRALIDGDGIDNYATAGGLSKIIQIRGPETGPFFKDRNFRYENPNRQVGEPPSSSQGSWRDSFKDFSTVASPDGLVIARQAQSEAEQAALRAQARVDGWLHERLGIPANQPLPEKIPGWTGKTEIDANGLSVIVPDNLKYPDYEPKWWEINSKPAAKRTNDEVAFYEDPAHRYKGLTPTEIQEFKLAKDIRDRYAMELRKENAGSN